MEILTFKQINPELPSKISYIRQIILNNESYNFSARFMTKILDGIKNCCYMAIIPNSIDEYPIDLLAIAKDRKYMQTFAVCGDLCIEIPIIEFVKQYENYEEFCSLEGCYAIPSERANKIKKKFESISYPQDIMTHLVILGKIAQENTQCYQTKMYLEYAEKVAKYRKDLIDEIKSEKVKTPFLVIPYHQ